MLFIPFPQTEIKCIKKASEQFVLFQCLSLFLNELMLFIGQLSFRVPFPLCSFVLFLFFLIFIDFVYKLICIFHVIPSCNICLIVTVSRSLEIHANLNAIFLFSLLGGHQPVLLVSLDVSQIK